MALEKLRQFGYTEDDMIPIDSIQFATYLWKHGFNVYKLSDDNESEIVNHIEDLTEDSAYGLNNSEFAFIRLVFDNHKEAPKVSYEDFAVNNKCDVYLEYTNSYAQSITKHLYIPDYLYKSVVDLEIDIVDFRLDSVDLFEV